MKALQEQVRSNPSDGALRIFLFQLLCIMGSWDRALTQLDTAADMDPSASMMGKIYRNALQCEGLRAEVFSGKRSPLIFGDPPEWIGLIIEALRLYAAGDTGPGPAGELRERAFENARAVSGSINGEAFEWLADADPRLGPTLEAIVNGRYFWIPFENIRSMTLEEPADLRDMVWLPVHFTWVNGGEMVGFIPTRYAGSDCSSNRLIQLARKTEWVEGPNGECIGLGQRVFVTNAGEYALLDTRRIELDTAVEFDSEAPAASEPGDA